MTAIPVNGTTVFLTKLGIAASAGVAISSNPQTGSIGALGTAVGTAQAGQGMVALSLTGVESATVPVALVGGALNLAGLGVAGLSFTGIPCRHPATDKKIQGGQHLGQPDPGHGGHRRDQNRHPKCCQLFLEPTGAGGE